MKALRSLSANKKRHSFLRQAAVLFFYFNALTFPLFADERADLTAALKKTITESKSDGMDIAEISRLLDAGADPNGIYDTWEKETFLILAARINNVELARLLLDHGADLNAAKSNGRSAVFYGKNEIINFFISYGARFDVMDKDGTSPLRSQAYLSDQSLAILILEWEQEHSPDFSARFENRKDYLTDVLSSILKSNFLGDMYEKETYAFIERLLNAGADPAAPNEDGFPVAYLAVKKDRNAQFILPLLIERGAPVDALNKNGETALYCAISVNNIELASFLLKRGADPNQQCKSGETALMAVSSQEAIYLLISSKANPDLQDKDGKTAMMKTSKPGLINMLFSADADPTLKDNNGRTVMHLWDYDLIEPLFDDLISRGCKIDDPDNEGYTPLIYAADFSSRKKVLLLLEKGANPNYRGPKGRTALHVYLLDIEKDIEKYNRNKDDLEERDKSVITALLEAGTHFANKDDDGDSSLITAIRISRKNAKITFLRDMIQKYASAEDIKIASAEAGKMISKEKKQKLRKAASENLPSTITALSFPIVVGGLSFLMPANRMGPVNGALTLGGIGFFLGGLIGANMHHGSEWSDMFGSVLYGLFGGIIGGAIGIAIACQPSVYEGFTNNPILYYTPTAVTAIIASVIVIRIWF